MPWLARDSGTWRTITAPAVRVGGTWRAVTGAWVRVGGTWRQFFSSGGGGPTIAISDASVIAAGSAGSVNAGYSLLNNGNVQETINSTPSTVGTWVSPASGMSGFEARATVAAGSGGTLTGTVGSWLSLGTSRIWSLSRASAGFADRTLTIEIRDAASLSVVATATITLDVEAF